MQEQNEKATETVLNFSECDFDPKGCQLCEKYADCAKQKEKNKHKPKK